WKTDTAPESHARSPVFDFFDCVSFRSRGHDTRRRMRVVIQDRREPPLAFCDGPALALGIVLDLIPLDLADAEIGALWMAKIEPAYGRAWPHCVAFGQLHADALALEQSEQRALFGVVGLRRIARRRTDAAILLGDELLMAERLIRGVAPEFLAHA